MHKGRYVGNPGLSKCACRGLGLRVLPGRGITCAALENHKVCWGRAGYSVGRLRARAVHNYVQWIFPTDEASMFNHMAPLMTPEAGEQGLGFRVICTANVGDVCGCSLHIDNMNGKGGDCVAMWLSWIMSLVARQALRFLENPKSFELSEISFHPDQNLNPLLRSVDHNSCGSLGRLCDTWRCMGTVAMAGI